MNLNPHLSMVRSPLLAASPTSETIRRKAEEILSRPEYQVDSGLGKESEGLWLLILTWILKPFLWLFDAMDGLPVGLRFVVVVVLSLVAIALLGHIFWSLISSMRRTPHGLQQPIDRDRPVDPAELETAADRAYSAGQYLEAVRILFRAGLLRIQRAEKKTFRRGITNRELLRRYRDTPLAQPLQVFVKTIDRKWYGGEPCELDDYEACRAGHSNILSLTSGEWNAVRA